MSAPKEFMSLEEFLSMPTGMVVLYERASYWLSLYRTAKASFDAHGDDGPPVGSTVESITSGYGGRAGVRLRLDGVCEANPSYFLLSRGENEYLCRRDTWWRDIRVIQAPAGITARAAVTEAA